MPKHDEKKNLALKNTNAGFNIENLFRWIIYHPKRVVIAGLIIMFSLAASLPSLTKDTRSDAFLAKDNPALLYRDQVKDVFGLSDPMVVAIVAPETIFTPDALNAVSVLSEKLRSLENIDPEGVTSLATENNIIGTFDGMEVEPFFEGKLKEAAEAIRVRDAIRDFPLYQGTLVARDETATLIVAEVLDDTLVENTYEDILNLIAQSQLPDNLKLYVAGEGAIAGYLGSYIDSDAQRLNPIAALIITFIVFIAFRRFASTFMANIIIAASALTTFGLMAAVDVPFFVITNALPVILIGIAVADSIHIYSEYFERRAHHPYESIQDSILFSMIEMWRPITLTTLTTAAGFMGLYFAAYMPPFKFFGLFTAFGVSMAWLYSILFLPAAMSLLKTEVHPKLAEKLLANESQGTRDLFSALMVMLGTLTTRFPKAVVSLSFVIILAGIYSATKLQVNDDRIDTFHSDESLYIADQVINSHFDGTNYLDVVIETDELEGIFKPHVLNKMEALQTYAETLANVQGSVSVVDYLKQMNRALNEGNPDYYRVPQDKDLVAQYFLLYSASGEPTDFEEEIDFDYQLANIRLFLNEGAYIENQYVVNAMETYIAEEFSEPGLQANLSGRVNLNHHWIKDLGVSHFMGMGIALFLVWLVSSFLFRSAIAGMFALIPVATSILLVYSAMVFFNIDLGIGTSMFSAVAIGLGVDFAIHTIDRIKSLYQNTGSIKVSLEHFYPTTGRALFFNLLAIAFGFGVLISSKVVPLNNFGTIVALSVTTSFLVSMTLLPALIHLFKPRFITRKANSKPSSQVVSPARVISGLAVIGLAFSMSFETAEAEELPNGRWVAEQVNAVDEGITRSVNITMTLTDRRGKERVRETKVFRKYYDDEKRTVLYYLSPRNVKNTAFLTFDYPEADKDDDQWLYLPALRKARRVSASDRGDYFLGTDLTYEDMKKEGKLELKDYEFETLGYEQFENNQLLVLQSTPINDEIAKELGYGKVKAWVDPSNWMIVKAKYWDINFNELKELEVGDIRQVNGLWTRHELKVFNQKTGHQTHWLISNVDYQTSINDKLFSRNSLNRGAPK